MIQLPIRLAAPRTQHVRLWLPLKQICSAMGAANARRTVHKGFSAAPAARVSRTRGEGCMCSPLAWPGRSLSDDAARKTEGPHAEHRLESVLHCVHDYRGTDLES